jgi:hypothetical protein
MRLRNVMVKEGSLTLENKGIGKEARLMDSFGVPIRESSPLVAYQ